jgi:hypothetical protein
MIQDWQLLGAELQREAHQVPGHSDDTRQFENRNSQIANRKF